ncbi:MAG TPA: hypothetical protein VJ826_01165 [Candidatus Polarisedimenticolaceae bacterium]|nr:hypothetical protein [Candidatus Polarisedimenticolaceae bacterium]
MKRFLSMLALVAAGVTVFAAVRTMRASPVPATDLVVEETRFEVLPGRQVKVVTRVGNHGVETSAATTVSIVSNWGDIAVPFGPLEPDAETITTFVSPPVPPGDHPVVVRVDPATGGLDADESNGVRAGIVHVSGDVRAAAARSRVVPELTGRAETEAIRDIRSARLAFAVYRHAEGRPTSRVERQWPPAGRSVPRASRVVLVLGASSPVPDLLGLAVDEARASLHRSDLEVGRLELRRTLLPGTRRVVRQDPAPGTWAERGAGVALALVEPYPPLFYASGLLGMVAIGMIARHPRRREVRLAVPAAGDPATSERVVVEEVPPNPIEEVSPVASVDHGDPDRGDRSSRFRPPPEVREDPPPEVHTEPPPPLPEYDAIWITAWDPGRQDVTWNLDTSQPTIVLAPSMGESDALVMENEVQGGPR